MCNIKYGELYISKAGNWYFFQREFVTIAAVEPTADYTMQCRYRSAGTFNSALKWIFSTAMLLMKFAYQTGVFFFGMP